MPDVKLIEALAGKSVGDTITVTQGAAEFLVARGHAEQVQGEVQAESKKRAPRKRATKSTPDGSVEASRGAGDSPEASSLTAG